MGVETADGAVTAVSGHGCKRGVEYARQEAVCPMRIVTAVVRVRGGMPLSVRTASPIPKKDIFACMSAIEGIVVNKPVTMGQILIEDVCGSGVAVIATKAMNE